MPRPLALLLAVACSPLPADTTGPRDPGQAHPGIPAFPRPGTATGWWPSTLDPEHPTGSTLMALNRAWDLMFVDPDRGSVHVRFEGTESWMELTVGQGPTRLTPVGDGFVVSLRGEDAVARFGLDGQLLAKAQVGLEPLGVVSRADGRFVYVAVSLDDRVLELDAGTLEVRRAWEISGEPRWLALSPDASTLWVASLRGPTPLTRIGLDTGEVSTIDLPPVTREVGGPDRVPLSARITGDPTWSDHYAALYVPVLYADTTTPTVQVEVLPDGAVIAPGGGEGYGGSPPLPDPVAEIGKFTPAIVEVPEAGPLRALYAGVTVAPDVSVSPLVPVEGRTYLSSVIAEGDVLIAPMEASRIVVSLTPRVSAFNPPFPGGRPNAPRYGGMDLPGLMGHPMESAPVSVAYNGGDTFVLSTLDRSVQFFSGHGGGSWFNPANATNELVTGTHTGYVGTFDEALPPEIARGRALFTTAVDPAISQGGVSCSTCHVDGRDDGLTWTFANGPRQTPSLAGRVSETAPVTWTQGVDSVLDEARLTITHRMGGTGLSPEDEAALVAFVDWTPAVRRNPGDLAVDRGRLVFESAGCGACHSGPRGTDGLTHTLRGQVLNTPGLEGVGATGPWLHDGSAATLREVLDPAINGGMAPTEGLTDAELDDLVAWLHHR